MPPTDVSFEFWQKLKDCLIEATYREDYFEKKTGVKAKQIFAFKFSEISSLHENTLNIVCEMIRGDKFKKEWTKKLKSRIITNYVTQAA